jgi:hypothetical protein
MEVKQMLSLTLNSIEFLFYLMLLASLLGHFRYRINSGEEKGNLKAKKCVICGSENPIHIKYTHNLGKLINFQIHMKIRNESSITFMEVFISNYLFAK